MEKNQTFEAMQAIVTDLTEGAFVHKVQGKMFSAQGFEKLGKKFEDHYAEEMGWVDKIMERMLDLGAQPQVLPTKQRELIADPKSYLEEDLRIQRSGVEQLKAIMQLFCGDPISYDILKDYLKDEEEDLFWTETQLDLIEKIGMQNWLVRQM